MNRPILRTDDPFLDPLDAMLVEIAISLQLPPGLHGTATGRYEAVRAYIERPGSPLYKRVAWFYPQGSMAIDATISTRGTDDEYDLDIIAEITGPDRGPKALLDLLEAALEGYPVKKIVRQTRCITLYYSDGMHLDVTPAHRRAQIEKVSDIAHAKQAPDAPPPQYVAMNAYGFVNWYRDRTPLEQRVALAVNQRLYERAGIAFAAADVEEVPEQTPLIVKSITTLALQLIKRHRNVTYAEATSRLPPSVMLSCHAGHAAMPGIGLGDMVIRQARWTARAIEEAGRGGRLLVVLNPIFPQEQFTDRWPETHAQQNDYARQLRRLADGLEAIRKGDIELEDLQVWLQAQFGDRVVKRGLEAFNQRLGQQLQAGRQSYTRGGGLALPARAASVAAIPAIAPIAARAHTNMGERRPPWS